MVKKGDTDHIKAMNEMKEKMKDSEAMKNWMNEKRNEFENASE